CWQSSARSSRKRLLNALRVASGDPPGFPKPEHEMEMEACGINHFSWFQTIRDRRTGEDLYPRLRRAEREGDWLADWHEIGLARLLVRRFGLYPSPATNHFGRYICWADQCFPNRLGRCDKP